MNPFTGKYPCKLSPTQWCKHGGNKSYNYGFTSGTASYCRKEKRFLGGMIICPYENAARNESPSLPARGEGEHE